MNPNNKLIIYKMAWAKCGLMAFLSASVAWTTSMNGVKWADLDGTSQFNVVLGCAGAVVTVVIAFLDRTISRIETEQEAIPGTPENAAKTGQTEFLAKEKLKSQPENG